MQYQITMTMTAPVKHKSDANVFTQDYVYDRYHMPSHSGGSLFPLLNDCSRACDSICSCIKMLWAMMYKWCTSMQAVRHSPHNRPCNTWGSGRPLLLAPVSLLGQPLSKCRVQAVVWGKLDWLQTSARCGVLQASYCAGAKILS